MKKKYIIPVCMLLAACSSNETLPTTDVEPVHSTNVTFSASIGGSSTSRSKGEDDYLHNNFIYEKGENGRKSRIRIVNTVNYSVPDFQTVGAYKEYEYNGEDQDAWEKEEGIINFIAYNENGFDWDEIRPTAASFVFEAACYPMEYVYFSNVATDQTEKENFWKADLLLAHHAQPLSQRYDLVKLKFHHVFAMIRVTIELPISAPQQAGGFPEGAIQKAELMDMYTGYETEYCEAIPNDGARTVNGTGEKSDIQMFPVIENEHIEGDTEASLGSQRYVYCAIIPAQSIVNRNIVRFYINTYTSEFEGNKPVIKETKYIFESDENIPLTQGYITDLELTSGEKETEIIQVKATINEWEPWHTTMPMEPDEPEPGTPDTPTE